LNKIFGISTPGGGIKQSERLLQALGLAHAQTASQSEAIIVS